jgi:small subunit ribosomal protein S20
MPNTKSAIKAARQNIKRRAINLKVLETIRKAAKAVRKAANKADAEKALKAAFAALDKAAKKNVIHRNNASRKKSRLSKLVAKLNK